MVFKQLLLALSSYPEPTPTTGLEQALEVAELLGTRVTALTFEVDFFIPTNTLANVVTDLPAMFAAEHLKSIEYARDLIRAFDAEATRRALVHHHILERGMTAKIPVIVTDYARLHDLTLFPLDPQSEFQRAVAECVIFDSGRPVLIIPITRRRVEPFGLNVIGVAWDFSRAATRAVADALPLLQRATTVRVVTVKNDKQIETRRSGAELARHFAAHGVEVILDEEDSAGRPVGTALTAYAAAQNLDLLVMGAYGHSRMRDFILGGATKAIIREPPIPVFLSH